MKDFQTIFGFEPCPGGLIKIVEMSIVNAKLVELAAPYFDAQSKIKEILDNYNSSPAKNLEESLAHHTKLLELLNKGEFALSNCKNARQAAKEVMGDNVGVLDMDTLRELYKNSASASATA